MKWQELSFDNSEIEIQAWNWNFEMTFQNRMWNEIFKYITQMKFEYNIWILKGFKYLNCKRRLNIRNSNRSSNRIWIDEIRMQNRIWIQGIKK